MLVTKFTDNPDGSADLTMDLSKSEVEMLVTAGLKSLLNQYIIELEEHALNELPLQALSLEDIDEQS